MINIELNSGKEISYSKLEECKKNETIYKQNIDKGIFFCVNNLEFGSTSLL